MFGKNNTKVKPFAFRQPEWPSGLSECLQIFGPVFDSWLDNNFDILTMNEDDKNFEPSLTMAWMAEW